MTISKIPKWKTYSFTLNSRAKSPEHSFRRAIEKLINPLVFSKIPFSETQRKIRSFYEMKSIDFVEQVSERKGQMYVELLPGWDGFFSDVNTGDDVSIFRKGNRVCPSLLEEIQSSEKGLQIETRSWTEIFVKNMNPHSDAWNSSGRVRMWTISFLLQKKMNTKGTFTISQLCLEEKALKVTRKSKKQF